MDFGFALAVDSTVKISDLLTSISVLVAGLALTYAVTKDRILRKRQQADAVRTAAAEALVKLERWAELSRSLGTNIQALLIEASELLGTSRDVGVARDYLWKGLNGTQRDLASEQRNLDIESAFVRLYGHRPETYASLQTVLQDLRKYQHACFAWLLQATQERVLEFQ